MGCFSSLTCIVFIFSIIDCSIAPGNVGANTYNTAIAIGEKAAVIIAEDLAIKGVSPFPEEINLGVQEMPRPNY